MKKGFVIGLSLLLAGSAYGNAHAQAGTHVAGFNSWWLSNHEPFSEDGISLVGEPDWDEAEAPEAGLEDLLAEIGASGGAAADAAGAAEESRWISLGDDWTITYYCPLECCNDQWAWQTSTQEPMQLHHTIAVDPDVIPYYTHVRIEGLDYEYVAEDCGGGIDGKQIDVLVENCDLAKELGVDRNVEVWVRR